MNRTEITKTNEGIIRIKSLLKNAVLAFLATLPVSAYAQEACNADIQVSTVGGPLFYINEPVMINVDLGAGVVTDDMGVAGWLDIFRFSYQMDCTVGDTWPDCTPAGNTVVFDPGSVMTTCTGEGDVDVTFTTSVVDQEVFFEVDNPDSIRNMSETSCNVSFNIMVTGVAGDNVQQEIAELTGFGNILGDEINDSICSNGLSPGPEGASLAFDLSTAAMRFRVTKEFSDDNTDPVNVHIRCDDGLPLTSSAVITKDSSVSFVLKDYASGTVSCDVWETPVLDYTPTYTPGLAGGVAESIIGDETGCHFNNISNGDFTCHITNAADPATFTVYKVWDVANSGGDFINEEAEVTIWCDQEILEPASQQVSDGWTLTKQMQGDDSLVATVDTSTGPAQCSASEQLSVSGVESEDDCGVRSIPAGGSSECTILNTVFFEGIPTLNQYGVALLALLMLGVGMAGFRRYS